MANNDSKQIIEALIFASDFPLSVKKICQIADDLSESDIEEIITELKSEYENHNRGFYLKKTAGGYEFVSRPEYSIWVSRLMAGRRKNRLSRAALETVAIIAYHQPVTGVEVERIRGVDCSGPLRTLLERSLIEIAGREKAPGRPIIYRTSDDFLRYFGVDTVKDLPRLEEIEEIIHYESEQADLTVEQLSLESGDSGKEEERQSDTVGQDNG